MRVVLAFVTFLILNQAHGQNDASPGTDTTYQMTAEIWCPYTCDSNAEDKGLFVEVVLAAMNEVKSNASYTSTTSRLRAIQNTIDGRADLILGIEVEEYDTFDIQQKFFILDESVLIVRRKDNITLSTPADLGDYRVGVITEYDYDAPEQPWLNAIENHHNKVESSINHGEHHLLKLLQRNRIDIAVMNYDVSKNELIKLQQQNEFVVFRKDIVYKIYPGFAYTQRGKEFKDLFSRGFSELLKKDNIKQIYDKYDVDMPDFSSTR